MEISSTNFFSQQSLVPLDLLEESKPTSVVDKCMEKLANDLNLPLDQIKLISHENVLWNNSGLGCAKPDEMVLMVMTPGHKITLTYGNTTYTFHTNASGSVIRTPNIIY